MMKHVKVLMSTYNGQKYLREQIDSILNQQGVEVSLLIRDDGSKDETLNILSEYEEKHSNIEIIRGENIGFAESFMSLIYKANEYDDVGYFAFSDQDDVWFPEKLYSAVKRLDSMDSSKMKLYFSNTMAVDEKLNPLFKTHDEATLRLDKAASLVRYFILGCTMVFDKNLVSFVSSHRPVYKIMMHDLWIHQTCAFLGEIVYDNEPRILYRQHSSNAAGVGSSKMKRVRRLKKSFATYERRHFRELNAKNLLATYGELFNESDYNLISAAANYRKNIMSRYYLFSSEKFDMGSKLSNLNIKFRIVFGLF